MKGVCTVNVQVGTELHKNLKLVVLDEQLGQNIFGLDWSDVFSLTSQGTSALDSIATGSHSCSAVTVSDADSKIALATLKSKFPLVFSDVLGRCTKTNVSIYLKPDSKPVFCKPRPLPFSVKLNVKVELDRLVNLGILTRINFSEWAAPIVVVSKPNGSVRICGDFKALNQRIQVDQHPLPSLDDILQKLQGGTVFSKIDLADAYFQLALDDDSKKFCVINTPFGLFQYQRMCFGVASSPANFQRCIDAMIADLPGVASFIDDIIVTGKDHSEHLQNLNRLFERISEYGFTVKSNKCEFFRSSVEYLGHVIDKNGKRPSDVSVAAIKQLPQPRDLRQLQAFLGKVNYYRSFIPDFTAKASSLYALLKKNTKFVWSSKCNDAFLQLKNDVISATQLAHYDGSKRLVLATDASQYGIGAVLSIDDGGKERPIAHASKTLSEAQKSYSQIEKEALSIVFGVTKFRQFLFGNKFTLVTDHKPLLAIFSPDKNIPVFTAQRLQRWALMLMAYQYEIRFKPTAQHGNADGLSRLPMGQDASFDQTESREHAEIVHAVEKVFDGLPLSHKEIREATLIDETLKLIKKFLTSGNWSRKSLDSEMSWFATRKHSLSIHNDVVMLNSDGFTRVVIPKSLRNRALSLLHEGHWGITKMKQMARRYIAWPSITRDIRKLVKTCNPCCQAMKAPDQEYREWPQTSECLQRIHLDFAGPFLGKMFMVTVDAHSKYPFVSVMDVGNTTSKSVISALREIFCIEGLPVTIVTDGGPQFTSKEFGNFCSSLAVSHVVSPSFHPASNGEAERFVQTLKTGLLKNCSGGVYSRIHLQKLLSTYRCTPHPSIDWKTPAEILHGRQPRNLLTLCLPGNEPPEPVDSTRTTGPYLLHSAVYARHFGRGPKWVTGTIVQILGKVAFIVRTDHGLWRRHRNQLQPRLVEVDSSDSNSTPVSAPISDPPEVSTPPAPKSPRSERASTSETQSQNRDPEPEPSAPVGRRYPLRTRKRPDFYKPV